MDKNNVIEEKHQNNSENKSIERNDNENIEDKDKIYLDDDEEEEFYRQCQNRRVNYEEKRNSQNIKHINNTISHSKFANKLKGSTHVKIYVLKYSKPFIFEISYTDTIKDLKLKIYKQIEKDPRFKLNYKSFDGINI